VLGVRYWVFKAQKSKYNKHFNGRLPTGSINVEFLMLNGELKDRRSIFSHVKLVRISGTVPPERIGSVKFEVKEQNAAIGFIKRFGLDPCDPVRHERVVKK